MTSLSRGWTACAGAIVPPKAGRRLRLIERVRDPGEIWLTSRSLKKNQRDVNTKDRRKQNRFFFYYVKYQPRGGKHIIKIGTVQNSELIVLPFFFFFLTFYIGFGGWKEDVLVSSAVQVKVESACLAVLRNTTLYITSCFILSFRAREHFANLSSESDARPYATSSSSLSTVTPSVWLGVEIAQLPWRMFDLGWAIVARERERRRRSREENNVYVRSSQKWAWTRESRMPRERKL